MPGNQIFDYPEETHAERLARKSQETPLMPIGILGLTLACLYGAYKYKRRGAMSTSVFLMQLRVGAQGAVVGTLTVGLLYTMARDLIKDMSAEKPTP